MDQGPQRDLFRHDLDHATETDRKDYDRQQVLSDLAAKYH
jgi:hypothetical protein